MKIRLRTLASAFVAALLFAGGLASGAALNTTTRADLMTAMHGEAFAYLKYMAFAEQARSEGHPEIATLFEKTANIEWKSHFATHAHQYGLVKTTADNLKDAIAGENYETTQMYPQMAVRATRNGDKNIAQVFIAVGKDESTHQKQFQAALKKLQSTH